MYTVVKKEDWRDFARELENRSGITWDSGDEKPSDFNPFEKIPGLEKTRIHITQNDRLLHTAAVGVKVGNEVFIERCEIISPLNEKAEEKITYQEWLDLLTTTLKPGYILLLLDSDEAAILSSNGFSFYMLKIIDSEIYDIHEVIEGDETYTSWVEEMGEENGDEHVPIVLKVDLSGREIKFKFDAECDLKNKITRILKKLTGSEK